jgi:hypothetical protein
MRWVLSVVKVSDFGIHIIFWVESLNLFVSVASDSVKYQK